MVLLRTVIFTTLALMVGIFAFVFFTFDSTYQLDEVVDSFRQGEYYEASKDLAHLEGAIAPSQLSLYKAYLLREEEDFEASNQELESAIKAAERHPQPHYLLEIYLNRAFNAFLTFDDEAFSRYVAKAKGLNPREGYVQFFDGIDFYLAERFAEAIEIWEKVSSPKPLSVWMEEAFEKVFTHSWVPLHVAHCQIEEGNYLVGRQLLERMEEHFTLEERAESAFLIGLSYAKEAEDKPWVAAMPYYQLAQSYFDQVPLHHKHFLREKKRIIRHLRHAAAFFIEQKNLEHMTFFVDLLEDWKASKELEELSSRLVDLLDGELKEENWGLAEDLATIISRSLKVGVVRKNLSDKYHALVEETVLLGDFSKLSHYWEIALLLSEEPRELKEVTSRDLAKKVFEGLEQKKLSLDQLRPYINFWSAVESDSKDRYLFSQQLVAIAGGYLGQKGLEQKALNLMELADGLPFLSEKKMLRNDITNELKKAYALAARIDDISMLTILYDAGKIFGIDSFGIEERSELSNQLEDASYLLKIGRYLEAEKRLEWIVKVDAKNHRARRLLGLVQYRQGHYEDVLATLLPLREKDKEIKEMIAVAQILTGAVREGRQGLKILANQRPLSDHAYLQLGYLDLLEKRFEESFHWLKKIRKPQKEAIVYLSVAAYEEDDWQSCLDYFHQLEEPYKRENSLRLLAMRSLMALERNEVAEETLQQMLKSTPSETEVFSPRYSELSKKVLENPDLDIIAGDFYREVLHNYVKALRYYSAVENPSPAVMLSKGETYLQLEQWREAEWLFKSVAQQSDAPLLKREAIRSLGGFYSAQKRLGEAIKWYRAYFSKHSDAAADRLQFVKGLLSLQLWEEAATNLELLQKSEHFSDNEELLLLESFVMGGKAKAAVNLVDSRLKEERHYSSLNKIKVARLMLFATARDSFLALWDRFPDFETLTLVEKQEMIDLLTELGKYKKARVFAEEVSEELERGLRGMMVLARLYRRLGEDDRALSLARQAYEINRYDPSVMAFLEDFDDNQEAIQGYLEGYQEDRKAVDSHLLADLGIARQLIHLGQLEASQDKLREARKLLQSLIDRDKNQPLLFFHLGRVLALEEDRVGSMHAFMRVVHLSPLHTEAYREIGKLHLLEEEDIKAIESLEKAVSHAQGDVESWVLLAQVHLKRGDVVKAKASLDHAQKFVIAESVVGKELQKIVLEFLSLQQEGEVESFSSVEKVQEALTSLLTTFAKEI